MAPTMRELTTRLPATFAGNVRGRARKPPNPVTNREFAKTLGRVLSRPAFLPLPALAVRGLLGEMGQALLLEGAFVVPRRLLERDHRFDSPTLEGALRHTLAS